jgi:arginine-tRNA-protein transferase
MESLFRYVAEPTVCGYRPDQHWSLEYEYVAALTPAEYLERMLEGWRRFGMMLFHPACATCRSCRSLRIPTATFRPDRSQRRAWSTNCDVDLEVGTPVVTPAKLALYDLYHAHQAEAKGWPQHPAKDAASYRDSFVRHPFPVEEWCYYQAGRLIGVGYVDVLPSAVAQDAEEAQRTAAAYEDLPGGLSAIYFFYDPRQRKQSLGVYNVLCLLAAAKQRGLPYVYLGYFVDGCSSMEYKARFTPNELRGDDGVWRPYR